MNTSTFHTTWALAGNIEQPTLASGPMGDDPLGIEDGNACLGLLGPYAVVLIGLDLGALFVFDLVLAWPDSWLQ